MVYGFHVLRETFSEGGCKAVIKNVNSFVKLDALEIIPAIIKLQEVKKVQFQKVESPNVIFGGFIVVQMPKSP